MNTAFAAISPRLWYPRSCIWRSLCLLALQLAAQTANAQARAAQAKTTTQGSVQPAVWDTSRTAPWDVGVFVGMARNSPSGHFLGTTAGFNHSFVGLQALTPVLRLGSVRISYGVQLLPFVRITGRTEQVVSCDPGFERCGSRRVVYVPVKAYAAGLSPFGLQIAAPVGSALSVYGATAAGGLIFDRPFPIPQARRVNFTLEFGGGVLVRVGHERWVRAGYKFHHLSNAYTAPENPGLDANVFYVGYDWPVRLPR